MNPGLRMIEMPEAPADLVGASGSLYGKLMGLLGGTNSPTGYTATGNLM